MQSLTEYHEYLKKTADELKTAALHFSPDGGQHKNVLAAVFLLNIASTKVKHGVNDAMESIEKELES